MSAFLDRDPTLENYWRAVILFGQNVASYKFALAKSLIELSETGVQSISLEQLAEPFSGNIVKHLSAAEVWKSCSAAIPSAKEFVVTSLRQHVTEEVQVRNLALNTQTSYVQQISLFARHFNKSRQHLGPEHIRAYQVYLTNEKKLAPGSIWIAVSALRFFEKVSLRRDWTFDGVIPAPKKPQTLPVILSPEEVLRFPGCVGSRKHRAILTTRYADGLRVSEAVRLIVPEIDSARMVIRVDQGKDRKDR